MKAKFVLPDNFPGPLEKTEAAAKEILKEFNKKVLVKKEFLTLVKKISAKHSLSQIPSWVLYLLYFKEKKLTQKLKNLLMTKNIRSSSGIVPVSIFTKNLGCPGQCVFCPTEARVPKSYFSNEPAVMRAIRNKYDAYKQVSSRLLQLFLSGHSIEKIELIVQGGTFSAMNQKYRQYFIRRAFDAANQEVKKKISNQKVQNSSKSLKRAQEINEISLQKIVGITVETRPDWIINKEIRFLRKIGITRVELGVQSLENSVLSLVKRGHSIIEVEEATKKLKDAGLKICYHMMPGLPGATPEKDLAGFKKLFSDERFQPDLLKIYPCVVTKDSELVKWYHEGKYMPYKDKTLTDLLVEIKKNIPPYVRILRLVRDIPAQDIIAGSKVSNLRQEAQEILHDQGLKCRCIRCREVMLSKYSTFSKVNLKLRTTKYKASEGTEYFLEYIHPETEILYALLRLRIPSFIDTKTKPLFKELSGCAIVRELHTYGLAIPIGRSEKNSPQHHGLGGKLLQKAEEITKENGLKKIAVTSGIGAREYYKKFGYVLQGYYMVKRLNDGS